MNFVGCVAFTAFDRDLASELIQWATSSEISHGLVVETLEGGTIEALWQGVVRDDVRKYYADNATIYMYHPVDNAAQRIDAGIKVVQEMVGKRYGYIQLIGVGLTIFLGSFGLRVRNVFRRGVISSELVYAYLEVVDPTITKGLDRDSISHDDLWRQVRNSPHWIKAIGRV